MQHPGEPAQAPEQGVLVQHRVPGFSDRWLVGEQPVPEAAWHDNAVALLKALLDYWRTSAGRDVAVYRNLAVRVRRERPRVGFDPDLLVVEPAPPDAPDLASLRLWDPGHAVPALVLEVVSPGHPYKDYAEVPDQCAALGVTELIVFDPMLVGPKALGGPQRIQLWRRKDSGTFERVASGEGPYRSAFLGAYLVVVEGGRQLRIADDEQGRHLWPTPVEAERGLREAERELKERALARVAELERELSGRRG